MSVNINIDINIGPGCPSTSISISILALVVLQHQYRYQYWPWLSLNININIFIGCLLLVSKPDCWGIQFVLHENTQMRLFLSVVWLTFKCISRKTPSQYDVETTLVCSLSCIYTREQQFLCTYCWPKGHCPKVPTKPERIALKI